VILEVAREVEVLNSDIQQLGECRFPLRGSGYQFRKGAVDRRREVQYEIEIRPGLTASACSAAEYTDTREGRLRSRPVDKQIELSR
jgi:hypothetical protein